MNRKVFSLLGILILIACQSKQQNVSDSKAHPLVGKWSNMSIRLEMNRKHGEPTSIYEVDSARWEEELKIRFIETSFNSDETFSSPHFNLRDSLILDQKGNWTADDNEIVMITTTPFADTTACKFVVIEGVAKFECWVDWDQDGEKDDLYKGQQRKLD